MKESVFVVLMTMALLACSPYANAEVPLLPEVKKILQVPPLDEKEMAQNSYVYLLTIDAKEDDYFDIAKEYLIANNQWLEQIIASHGKQAKVAFPRYTSIFRGRYLFPCNISKKSLGNNCLVDVLKNKQQVMALINKNQHMLARYEQISLLPYYHSYKKRLTVDYYTLSSLELFKAVMAIDDGDIDKGLNLLQQEINFIKRVYASKTNISTKLNARMMLLDIYYTLSNLLNTYPELTKSANLIKVKSLLTALPTEDQLNLEYAMRDDLFDELVRVFEYNDYYLQKANEQHVTYNLNKTLNKTYLTFVPYIKFTQLTLAEKSDIYLQGKLISQLQECNIENNKITGDCDKDNLFGDSFITTSKGSDAYYQLYDVYNYLALINLQLDILVKGLKAEQIPAFLVSAGDSAINIMTRKPFVWNKKDSTIRTDYLAPDNKISKNPLAVKVNVSK